MKPQHLLLSLLTWCILANPAPVAAGCDPNAPPDCSCGKLPVCVFSGHPDGMYSDLYAKSKDPTVWQGFGQGESDYGMAMQIEDNMAKALAAAYPCLDVIPVDSYLARTVIVAKEGKTSGLQERIRQAHAAGDTATLEQLTQETDALFDKWGLGDLPWADPDLASAHLGGRLAGCISTVKLSGSASNGNFQISATAAVPMGEALDDTQSSASASSPEGGLGELAKQVAGQLAAAHQKLFSSCQETVTHCITTDFELSHQRHRCDYTQYCNTQAIKTWSEEGDGIGMGRSSVRENTCCSLLAAARGPEGDEEDRDLLNQIWCPGTWNLWGRDFDCDGVPNADDPTPWPPGHDQ